MNPQMKSIIATLSLAFPQVLTAAGPSTEEMAFYKAYKNGAQAKDCLRVVDLFSTIYPNGSLDASMGTPWTSLSAKRRMNYILPSIRGN